jgi:acetoacetate decarboxylase
MSSGSLSASTSNGNTNRAGRLDTTALASNQPASNPLYPSPPWKVFNSRSLVVTYETDLEPVLDLLPPELSPLTDPPQVVCYMQGGYEFGVAGSYSEMAPLIPVLYEGEPHIYPWVVYLGEGTEEWFAAGREVFADSKKLGRIEVRQELGRGLIMGTVERPAGHRLVTMIIGPLESQGDAADFGFLPVLSLRILPDSSGDRPQIADLLRKSAPSTVRAASDGSAMLFSGPATIELGVSEQDPLYRLPVRRVLGGLYVELGTINEEPGQAIKSYLSADESS